ncbi:putative membrane protein [Streptococcus sanguinis]|uniref:insulin activator factor n=1 Tax=Streptococcus sanguinis TaxID=1305 RepID=UPI001CC1B3E9|nr:insulin activator factor [Streptococcus sanguinis]MBZ2040338.1 insulin activator factor [Streptococcus sanguinis]MCC3170037.1 putative membrane protein [Streptococcus sanguinis]
MKSNKLLLVNGIVSILGGLLILYASSKRWHWKIVALVPKLVENSGWGGLIVLISLLFLGLSIVGMAHYSEDSRVNKMSHKLLSFAFLAGVIPFLGEAAGLLALISGSFYLQDFQKIKSNDKAD